jgi:pectate lyase
VDYHLTWTDTNYYDEATITRANDSQTTMIDWLDADGTVAFPTEYGYLLDSVENVPEIVQGAAGIVAGAGG